MTKPEKQKETAVAYISLISHLLLASFLSLLLTVALARLAPSIGLIDSPDTERKNHAGTPALVGGLALFLSIASVMAFFMPDVGAAAAPLLGAALLVVVTGALDDRLNLNVATKLVLQLSAAVVLVFWGGIKVASLGHILIAGEPLWLGWFGLPFTLLCIVVLLNAWNMIDGLNGLCAGISLQALLWFVATGMMAGVDRNLLLLAGVVIFALIGFLPMNLKRKEDGAARAFLGDAGSFFIGLLLGWLMISAAGIKDSGLSPIVIAWILAYPIFDMARVSLKRILARKNPLQADRQHLHHLLVAAGYTPERAARLIIMISFIYGAIGFVGWSTPLPEPLLFAAWLGALGLQYFLSGKLAGGKP